MTAAASPDSVAYPDPPTPPDSASSPTASPDMAPHAATPPESEALRPLRGVVPVVPTPFHPDESIDFESLGRVVDWIAGRGLGGLCLPAYGSEFYKLTESERHLTVAAAVEANASRVPVVAQANHPSARAAADLARRYQEMGADAVSVAVPRQFGASDSDIVAYCGAVAAATSLPVMVQDFNPGGLTVGAEVIAELSDRHPNFGYVKLEDPMMLDKLLAIRGGPGGRVGILEGWGGLYMLEGIGAGIDGIMPGAAVADLLDAVFAAASSGRWERAHDLFGSLLPFVVFALGDFELFLQMEKRTLVRRGLIATETVRSLSRSLSPAVRGHAEWLIDQVERAAADAFGLAW